ncbi:MAG: response regulator, partial [Calditrichia bacterium]|nr:response regulator [Calditrichia bacterium]
MKNKNLHILYIENDEQDFWLLQQALQDCTIENKITRLTYAEKAIEWIVKKPGMFDLVITEQDLPGISGIELKKRIDLLGLSIPVIVLSDKEPSEILQDNNNMRDIFFLDKKNDDSYLKDITVLLSKMQNTSTSNIDDESNSVFPFLEDSLKYIQIFDQKAIIKYAYELSAGKNKDKLIGQKIFDFVSFEYQNEVMDIINDVLQTGNPKSFSIKEGNEEDSKRYLFHLFPVQQIGTEYLLASIVIDISRFEKGEIDSMADTAIILDKDGNVIASNFTSSYLTKYSSNDIIGLNICDIIDSK